MNQTHFSTRPCAETPSKSTRADAGAIHAPVAIQETLPCYGVCCNVRAHCVRYLAVDLSDPHHLRIDFCPVDAEGKRTMFIQQPCLSPNHQAIERRAA
jgi:hypothetical protein